MSESIDPEKVAIYARVSTEEQARNKEGSIKTQIKRCRSHLVAEGLTEDQAAAAKVFKDEGISGKDFERPAFQALLHEVERQKVTTIIFTSLSRVSRSVVDFLSLVEDLSSRKVELVCLKEKIDTSTPHGRLIMTVLIALAQFEREQTAERTRENMRARAERGLYNGGRCPMGYRPRPDHKGYLDVVEPEAVIVRSIFQHFVETGSVPRVVERLEAAGVRRPAWTSGRGTYHPEKPIKWDAVRNVLANPTYIAMKEINRNNRALNDEEMAALPEDERYGWADAVWEPLVSRDVWDRATAIREQNRLTNGNSVRKRKREFILTGLVECAGCGQRLQGATSKGGQYAYYQHKGSSTDGCAKARYPATPVERTLVRRLSRLADDDALFNEVLAAANGRLLTALPQIEAEISRTRSQISEAETKGHHLAEFLMSGDSVPPFLHAKAKEVQDEIDAANKRLARLQREKKGLEADRVDPEQYRAALRDLTGLMASMNPEEKRRLLGYLVEKVALGGDGITLFLRSETLETPDVNHPEGEYPRGGEWLPERLRRTVAWGEPRISPIVGLELALWHEAGRVRDPVEEVLERARRFGLKMGGRPLEELASVAWSLTWTRDPFDRVIAATAMADDLPLLTADRRMLEHCPVAEWDAI